MFTMSDLENLLEKVRDTEDFRRGIEILSQEICVEEGQKFYHDAFYANDRIYSKKIENFSIATGAYRVVLIGDGYVLKKNAAGTHNCDHAHSYDRDEFYPAGNVDFCAVETKLYKKFCERGVERFFAPLIYLGNGIYFQKRYNSSLWDGSPIQLPEWIRHYVECCAEDDWCEFYSGWANLESLYRKVENDAFINLVAVYESNECDNLEELQTTLDDFDINDLHDGNFFWDGEELIIVDYAGDEYSDTSSHVDN